MAFYSARIAPGSTTVNFPSYQHMTFQSVQGADANINANGDLQFVTPTLINSQLLISITAATSGNHFVGLYYQWDSGPILPLVPAFAVPGGIPVITNKVIPRSGTTLILYIAGDVAGAAWGVGYVTPTEEDTVFPPDGTQFTFTEQPSQLVRVEAVIADGSYSSSNVNDLVAMPFAYIRFGPAAIDPYNNLQFSDIVIDDFPQLTITLQVATAPANNFIWGQWDYSSTSFLITETHLYTTGPITISNIPIPPPNFQLEFANGGLQYGQGHYLALFISCSTTATFNWSNGRVFGIEASLASGPVEYAPIVPSVAGINQPIIANSIQGGRFGPPIGPPLGS